MGYSGVSMTGSNAARNQLALNEILMAQLEAKKLKAAMDAPTPRPWESDPNRGGYGQGPQQYAFLGGKQGPAADPAAAQAARDRELAAQMAAQQANMRTQSENRRAEASNASALDEQRKRDAAARALALFRSTGGSGGALAIGSARGELA